MLLLAVTGLILIHTSPVQRLLLDQARNMARRFGVTFEAETLDLQPLSLAGVLSRVVYEGDGIRVELDRLAIDLPWNVYGSGGITISSLDVDGARISVVSAEPAVPEPSGEGSTLPQINVKELSIRNASFTYENQSTRVDIPSITITARNGQGTLALGAPVNIGPDLSVRLPETPVQFTSERVEFGTTRWDVSYGERSGSGSATGAVAWSPGLSADLRIETEPLDIEQWDDISASARIRYDDGALRVSDFEARRGPGILRGEADISDMAKAARLSWNSVGLEPSGVSGQTSGQIELAWQNSDFTDVDGKGQIEVTTQSYGRANADIAIQDAVARLDIQAAAMGADVQARLTADMEQRLGGSFRVTHREYGLVVAEGTLGGTARAPVAQANLTADDVAYAGIGPADASASVSYRDNRVFVRNIEARMKNSEVPQGDLNVDLSSQTIQGRLPLVLVQLQDFVQDAAGQVRSAASISGTLKAPVAELNLSSDGIDIGGTHIDSVQANARFADQTVEVLELVARQNEGFVDAAGRLNLETEAVEGNVQISNLQITQVRELSAFINLDANIQGSYKAPEAGFSGELQDLVYLGHEHGSLFFNGMASQQQLSVGAESPKYSARIDGNLDLTSGYPFSASLTANNSNVQYDRYAFLADGDVKVNGTLQPFALDTIEFEKFTASGEGVNLQMAGTLDSGIKVGLQANLAELPLQEVELTGLAEIDAVVQGTLTDPEVEGTLRTANTTARLPDMPEAAALTAAVDFTRSEFSIRELRAEYAEAVAEISGGGTLRGTGTFEFRAENIRPQRLFPERPLAGLISVEGKVGIASPSLAGIEGDVTLTQLQLNVQGVEVEQIEPAEIVLRDQLLSVTRFNLSGPETEAAVSGTANLANGVLNLDIRANTDLRILEGFIAESNALGRIESVVSLRGTASQPDMRGFVNLAGAEVQLAEPAVLFSGVNAAIRLTASRVDVEQATGEVNGGEFNISGGTGISSDGLQNADMRFTLQDTQLEYPEGLQSQVAADLVLTGDSPALQLSGQVRVLDALYREDINLEEQLFERLTPEEEAGLAGTDTPSLARQINLDVRVETEGPVAIANNVANLDLTGSFRIRGTATDPVILGRAAALEGGEVYFGPEEGAEAAALGERRDRYIIERGTVDFNNPVRTEPTLDLEATHELEAGDERYLIRLRASGTPTDLRTELTSDPYLAEPDIIAMLLTGRTFSELQGAHLAVAREQLLNYVSGQLTSRLFQGAGTAIGLDTVTIEPVTIASEEDVSARVTLAKDITDDLSLIFSQNLAGPRDQSWILNYSTYRDFVLRGVNRPDQDQVRAELRHGLEFGGGPPLPRRIAPKEDTELGEVVFEGSTFSDRELSEVISEPGDPYNIYRMNEDIRALRQFFASKDYPDANVRGQRETSGNRVNVKFTINQGPRITFQYQGAEIPDDVQERVVQTWVEGFAEASSLQESIELLLRHLRNEGYLRARVSAQNQAQSRDERHYVFQIEPGAKFDDPKWVFHGIEPLEITDNAGIILEDPEAVRERIESQLRGRGFLDAKATVPELILDRGEPRFEVTVEQGLQYMVTGLAQEGNTFFTDDHLNRVVILGPSEVIPPDEAGAARPPEAEKPLDPFPYTSDWVSIARRRIMGEYWQQGFNDVQIGSSTEYVPGSGRIEVHFYIQEGERQQIADIRINGDEKTLRHHVLRYLKFAPGDPVDYTRINVTRKQLYDTGLFKRVDIEVTREDQGYVTSINLNERAPWSFRYGVTVTDHRNQDRRDLGVSTELTNRNLLGKGILAGTSFRVDPAFREGRFFASLPVFLNRNVTSTAALFRTRETLPDSVANTWGFTLQQQWRLKDYYLLTYDYGYRRVGTFERDLTSDDPEIINGVIPVARFNATLSRDTRDDLLNATRGTFLSNSFELAPPGIGSSIQYVRNYAQYLRFREVWRPNLIWASAYRIGLARGFNGQELVPTDRFTAGGSTTLRAFDEDRATLQPGNALFITNQELRFPLFWRFGAVAFFDVGNVYERTGAIRVFDQRYSPGFGLRIDTPLVLLRMDLGLNLWPRTGENRRRFSFGIGQAF